LLWGFTGVLGRVIALDEYALVIYRMLFTTAILAGILWHTKQFQWIGWADCKKMIGIGCLIAMHWVAFYGSIKKANASIALICLSTSSMYTALLGPIFFKRKINFLEIAFSLLAFFGMALIYKFETKYVTGILFGLIAAMLSAIFTLFNKQIIDKYPSRLVAFYEIGGGVWVLFLIMPLYHYYFPQIRVMPSIKDIGWLLVLSYFCTVLGQSLALSALKKLSTFTVVLAVNLEPVYGIALAFLFYNEQKNLTLGFYYGIFFIALSVILHTYWMYATNKKNKITAAEK
jgi:drug/metabolite transporter (DMT)-like permease